MIAKNGWAVIIPYVEELRFNKYESRREEAELINLAFIRKIKPTSKKTKDGVPLVEIFDGSYPSVMIEKPEADKLRNYLIGMENLKWGGKEE